MTPREQGSIEKVREALERIARLSEEKTALALELRRIVARSVGRLDFDLGRIRKAMGTEDQVGLHGAVSGSGLGLPSTSGSYADLGGLTLGGSLLGGHSAAQILPQLQAHVSQSAILQAQAAGSFRGPLPVGFVLKFNLSLWVYLTCGFARVRFSFRRPLQPHRHNQTKNVSRFPSLTRYRNFNVIVF